MPACSASASRPIVSVWPTSTTRSSRCRLPASIRLPHQLEAVYGYFMQLPRIRFLLGRRSRRRQDDHGGPAAQGTQGPRPRAAGADRHAGEPHLPVAARTDRQVPRAVRRHPRRRAAGQLRPEPLAGARPGHHLGLLGVAGRGRPRKPAPLALGPGDRRRGPQDERPQRGPQDLRLPPGREPLEDDRPLPA